MKAVIVVLGVLVVALGAGGGWYFRTAEANKAILTAERDQAKTALASEGGQSKAEIARLTQSLADAEKQRETSAQSRDALLEAVRKSTRAWRLASDDVARAVERIGKAQVGLYESPSAQTFAAFKGSLAGAATAMKDAAAAVQEFGQYVDEKESVLGLQSEDSAAIRDRLTKATMLLADWSGRVAATQRSLHDVNFTTASDQAWQTSDLAVSEGDAIAFTSTGHWRWGRSIGNPVGAEGEDAGVEYRVIDNYGNGALLARIRGSETVHLGAGIAQAERSGKLDLRINDTQVGDNTGSLEVSMWSWKPITFE